MAAVTREEREQFLKALEAHAQTIAICEACAATTRDLAAEVNRGGLPKREDLQRTSTKRNAFWATCSGAEGSRALADVTVVNCHSTHDQRRGPVRGAGTRPVQDLDPGGYDRWAKAALRRPGRVKPGQ